MNGKVGCSVAAAALVGCMVGCEVCKQLSNYGVQYQNGGTYPIPGTGGLDTLNAI